jgi:tRNA(fMet)-specific endonuclease VapC
LEAVIYLLDTDILIYMIRGLKRGSRHRAQRAKAMAVVKRCQEAQDEDHSVAVSAITVSELEFGARGSDSYDKEIEAVHKILRPFDACDYDAVGCAVHYGRIRHELETAGRTIGSMDLLIAAHAMSLGLRDWQRRTGPRFNRSPGRFLLLAL